MKKIPVTCNIQPETQLAIAQLAAAAISANPTLTIQDAVKQAQIALNSAVQTQLSQQQIVDSIHPDKIMCFEDDTWHTMLRRYLRRKFNLSPQQYREKWGLSDEYPLVAPGYAKIRSGIAKKSGLGKN
ncbi:MucR family transcriptional regulator [Bacteroidia bacterium]|nr:MucR family transcriptional regulator [Bacteroidia bacterium]